MWLLKWYVYVSLILRSMPTGTCQPYIVSIMVLYTFSIINACSFLLLTSSPEIALLMATNHTHKKWNYKLWGSSLTFLSVWYLSSIKGLERSKLWICFLIQCLKYKFYSATFILWLHGHITEKHIFIFSLA